MLQDPVLHSALLLEEKGESQGSREGGKADSQRGCENTNISEGDKGGDEAGGAEWSEEEGAEYGDAGGQAE